jgi:hypothetical protein
MRTRINQCFLRAKGYEKFWGEVKDGIYAYALFPRLNDFDLDGVIVISDTVILKPSEGIALFLYSCCIKGVQIFVIRESAVMRRRIGGTGRPA